jgi:hypothetical protein
MKALATADRYNLPRYIAHQAYYSLIGRDYEWELMPLGLDQGVGAVVWSPLGWGRLTGKIRRGQPLPANSRLHKTSDAGPPVDDEYLYTVVDALEAVAEGDRQERAADCPELAAAAPDGGHRGDRRARRSAAASQPGAVGWNLSAEQVAKLDAASKPVKAYPYWHQAQFGERNPSPVG